MKMKQRFFTWGFSFLIIGLSGLAVMPAFSGAPPLTEEFLEATLPGLPFSFNSSTEGRIELVADSSLLETADVPGGGWIISGSHTAANRMRGNYYRCDQTVNLQKQTMYLGRSAPADILFSVYESSTEGGTYTLKGSSTITVAVGTNIVTSGEMNVTLSAGKFYIIGAAWSDAVFYRWTQPQTVTTGFGEQLSGYYLNAFPTGTTAAGASTTTTLYPQQLIYSTNQVVRMDDSVGGSLFSTNSMDLIMYLDGYTDVTLEFRHRAAGEDPNPADGIFFSDDSASTFTKVYTLSNGTTGWQNLSLDVDALAATNGLSLNNSFVIRFQQADNYGWPTDGREFDGIKVYSKPDLKAVSLKSGGSTSVSKLWKGFTVDKQIPLEFAVESRGGKFAFSSPSIMFEYSLDDSGGISRWNADSDMPWNINAMEIKTNVLTSTLSVPASMHLPDLNYTVHAFIDTQGDMDEALENNNDINLSVTVNHYSGNLWFGDIETDITISDWGTRVANSPSEHWITGTGVLDGQSFAFTNLKVDKNLSTLDYVLDPTETAVINVPFPGSYTVGGVTYWRDGGVDLSKNGAFADIKVLLPAGCGVVDTSVADTMLLEPTLTFPNEKLLQALYPNSAVQISGSVKMVEETKPLAFAVSDIEWRPTTGEFLFNASSVDFVRESYYSQLESQEPYLLDPAMAKKKSNTAYYRSVHGLIGYPKVHVGSEGEALMDSYLTFTSGAMEPHFPYGADIKWSSAFTLGVTNDLLVATGSRMKNLDPIGFYFDRNCAASNCSGNASMGGMGLYENGETFFDPNGGLRIPVSLGSSGATLEWGARQDGLFAQGTMAFSEGTFYMPGTFIRGDQSNFQPSENFGPGEILLSGIETNGAAFERPGGSSYQDGFADYAGVNLRLSKDGDVDGYSVLGGTETGRWPLTNRSKYYVRRSGVSGIHEAVSGSFPATLQIYGYPFGFSNYGLSFLSNTPDESRINGDVSVPQPCNIDMQFKNMNLCCLGELEDADLANSDSKTLQYWDADIQPQSLFFAPTAGSKCTDSARKLCMGITTQCANFDQPLSGVLAFMPEGGLGRPADEIEGVPSRLSVPNEIEFDGPSSETYYYNPVAMPYYNDYAASGDSMSKRGWINFAGNLDVAFFNDLQVQLHTSAGTNSAVATIHMMGGWSNGSLSFFNSDPDGFDTDNAGYPVGSVADYSAYRNPSSDAYRVRAKRDWLNVVGFDYPLDWSSSAKSFKSPNAVTNDLLVLKVQHQTDYLSAKNAEISFGMQYDGLPQINLANMAFNAIDEATGMSAAFTDSVGDLMRDTIDAGVGAFSDTLSDLPDQLLGPVLDPLLDSLIDDFYTNLYSAYVGAPNTDYYSAVITNYIYGASGNLHGNVQYILQHLDNNVYAATDLLAQINTNLDRAVSMIDAFTSVVTTDTNGIALPPSSQVVGLLNLDSGSFDQLAFLGKGVLEKMASTLYDSVKATVQTELNEQLDEAKPTLSSISQTLLDLRSTITNVQAQLTVASNLGTELHDILNSSEMQAPIDHMNGAIADWFAALPSQGNLLEEYSPEAVKAMLRNQIKDAFYGSLPCGDIQQMVRSRLYEVEASIEESLDSVFQQLNKAMRDFVSQYVAQLDDKINGALGDLGSSIGAGQIDGYAHIRNDSLTELRLDGKFQWKVPKEMNFNAFLLIKQLDSKQAGACGMAGATLPEVTVGTTDMEMDMLESKIRADISVKVAFISTNSTVYPIGLGGSFNMKEGKIGFESFAITKLYAAVAFGAMENYLSAAVHCTLTDYEVEGGIFLGKTCTLDPFSWDTDVQSILGDPPFTGIYVYGQGWIPVPIVDYGCMLQIRVGLGAGIFAFLEGPIGGKVYMGLDGTALCVVNVGAEVTLVGVKDGDDLRMKGKGKVRGRVGACPFCVKFSKTIGITYDNGDWGVDL